MNRNWNTYISKNRPFSDFFWTWNIEKQQKKTSSFVLWHSSIWLCKKIIKLAWYQKKILPKKLLQNLLFFYVSLGKNIIESTNRA